MQVVTYAEGDLYFFQASSREGFAGEISDLCEFHKKQPPAYIAYSEDGTRTEFYDRRITPEEAKNDGQDWETEIYIRGSQERFRSKFGVGKRDIF